MAKTIGANQTITVKQNQVQTVVQNQQETVVQNQSVTVGLNQAETVGIVRALSVGEACQRLRGGGMSTSVALMHFSQAGSIFLNGTAINPQGAQAISDDGPVISRDCGAAKNLPDAPE